MKEQHDNMKGIARNNLNERELSPKSAARLGFVANFSSIFNV